MLHFHVEGEGKKLEFIFAGPVVTVGRNADNDLVLIHEKVSRKHASFTVDERGVVMMKDLGSTSGTFVDEEQVEGPCPITPENTVRIGTLTMRVRVQPLAPEDVTDDTEERFLERLRVHPTDDETRAVYADWLEERGAVARAEYLRIQTVARQVERASDPLFATAAGRLAALADAVGVGWRARVAMTFVEQDSCAGHRYIAQRDQSLGFELACPNRWESLRPTSVDGVRHCTTCRQEVYFVASIDDARTLAQDNVCIAIDLGVARSDGDLLSRESAAVMGRPAPKPAHRGRRLPLVG